MIQAYVEDGRITTCQAGKPILGKRRRGIHSLQPSWMTCVIEIKKVSSQMWNTQWTGGISGTHTIPYYSGDLITLCYNMVTVSEIFGVSVEQTC